MSIGSVALSPFASYQAMAPSAIIVGSTGAVGRQLLHSLLSSSHFDRTYEIGRRKTEYPVHGVQTPSPEQVNRLSSVLIPNEAFEDPDKIKAALPEAKDWTSVYITLGTTRANAGSAEAFQKIDKDCEHAMVQSFSCVLKSLWADVINAARAAKLDIDQKLIYCSVGRLNLPPISSH